MDAAAVAAEPGAAPRYTVRLSPELRRLRAGTWPPARGDAAEGASLCTPPLAPVRLRRDGARPLAIRAACLFRAEERADLGFGSAVLSLALFLAVERDARAERLYLALACELPDGAPGWSRHAAGEIADVETIRARLAQFDPASGLLVRRGAERDRAESAGRLAAAYRRLLGALSPSLFQPD